MARQYVEALIDPDILELRKKTWNKSVYANSNERVELGKTLFEVKHGLKDFTVTDPKERKLPIGCDSRDAYDTQPTPWNFSNQLIKREKQIINDYKHFVYIALKTH